jgi:hypothetical protein
MVRVLATETMETLEMNKKSFPLMSKLPANLYP